MLYHCFVSELFSQAAPVLLWQSAFLRYCIADASSEDLPLAFTLILVLLEHGLVGAKHWHDIESQCVPLQGCKDHDAEAENANTIVEWQHRPCLIRYVAWHDWAHTFECTALKR